MQHNRGTKYAFTADQARDIQHWLIREKRWRDLALIMLGIDSLFRSIDLRHLKYEDVIDTHGNVRASLVRGQEKNKRTVECYLSAPTCEAVAHWVKFSEKQVGDYLFTRLRDRCDLPANTPISRDTIATVVKQCASAIGLDPARYSTKTLRKSRVNPILKLAQNDYQVPRVLLGHADIRSTIAYCAIETEKALDFSKAVQFFDEIDLSKSSQNLTKNGE